MWNTFSGTKVGPFHKESQDALGIRHVDDVILMAVADGAGSLSRSGDGAVLAVESSLDYLESVLTQGLTKEHLEGAVLFARECVLALDEYRQYGSTLVVVALAENAWIAAAVGDSFLVARNGDQYTLFTGERISEFTNITALLTSDKVNVVSMEGYGSDTVILSSDGLEYCSLEKGVPFNRFWTPIINQASEGKLSVNRFFDFLESKDLIVDDTTLVGATRNLTSKAVQVA